MGWTSASGPKCSAVTWKTNPRIMLASPASQIGRRASRKISQISKPVVWAAACAPSRWHTDEVAVHRLATMASGIALSMRPAHHLRQQITGAADAGIEVVEEAVDGQPLGLDGGAQILLQLQALPGELTAGGAAGAPVMVGLPDLRHPVLVAQYHGHFLEVEAEQGLELADPRHPGKVVLRVAAQPPWRAATRREQANLLVIPERALGHSGTLRRGTDAQQVPAVGGRLSPGPGRLGAGRGGRRGRAACGTRAPCRPHLDQPAPCDGPSSGALLVPAGRAWPLLAWASAAAGVRRGRSADSSRPTMAADSAAPTASSSSSGALECT